VSLRHLLGWRGGDFFFVVVVAIPDDFVFVAFILAR
jgi:hypothetical protein